MRVRKKPVEVEAYQYVDGQSAEAIRWVVENGGKVGQHLGGGCDCRIYGSLVAGMHLVIRTLEGGLIAPYGWWIIRGVAGEFYPCRPDIFAATYDEVRDET